MKKTIKICLMLMLGMLISISSRAISVGASSNYNSKVLNEATSTMSEDSIDMLLNHYDSVFVNQLANFLLKSKIRIRDAFKNCKFILE